MMEYSYEFIFLPKEGLLILDSLPFWGYALNYLNYFLIFILKFYGLNSII